MVHNLVSRDAVERVSQGLRKEMLPTTNVAAWVELVYDLPVYVNISSFTLRMMWSSVVERAVHL